LQCQKNKIGCIISLLCLDISTKCAIIPFLRLGYNLCNFSKHKKTISDCNIKEEGIGERNEVSPSIMPRFHISIFGHE